MAKKATITPVTDTVNNASAINTQLNAINNQLDNTLSLDGSTPNAMNADLDLNSNDILNVKDISADRVFLGGSLLSTSAPLVVDANTVNFTPTGTLSSVDVQAALVEINTDLAASTGSSLVGYTQGGAGSVATTVQSKLRESVSVKDFGATGDGVTDDTAAFDSWITALGTSGSGYIPAGTYLVNTGRASFGVGVQVSCHPEAEIIPVGDSATLFKWVATYGSPVALSANALTSASTVSVTPGAETAFLIGDMVKIKSTYQPAPVRTAGVTDGEISFVIGTSSGVITLSSPIKSKTGYNTADTATIQKITTKSHAGWSGGKISGVVSTTTSNEMTFLYFQGCHQPYVRGVVMRGSDRMGVGFSDCVGFEATSNLITDAIGNVTAYGVNIMDASQGGWVAHNHFINVRHAVTTTNQTAIGGVPRSNKAWHNTIEYTSEAILSPGVGGDAMDCHAASDGHDYSYNTIRNSRGLGIICEGADFTAIGNVITDPFNSGIMHMNYSLWTARSKMLDNDITNPGNDGIEVRNGNAAASLSTVVLRGNRITANVSGFDDFKVDPNGSTVTTAFVQNNIGSIDKFNISATRIILEGNRSAVGSRINQEAQRQAPGIISGKVLFYPHLSGRNVITAGTEASAATDNLDLIETYPGYALEEGHMVTIIPASNTRDVVIRDQAVSGAAGLYAIQTPTSASITMDVSLETVTLIWRGTDWTVIASEVAF
jgi:hypothetical protein